MSLLIFLSFFFLSAVHKKLCQLCICLGGALFFIACFPISVQQYTLPRLILLSTLMHYIALPKPSLAGIMALCKLIMITI